MLLLSGILCSFVEWQKCNPLTFNTQHENEFEHNSYNSVFVGFLYFYVKIQSDNWILCFMFVFFVFCLIFFVFFMFCIFVCFVYLYVLCFVIYKWQLISWVRLHWMQYIAHKICTNFSIEFGQTCFYFYLIVLLITRYWLYLKTTILHTVNSVHIQKKWIAFEYIYTVIAHY